MTKELDAKKAEKKAEKLALRYHKVRCAHAVVACCLCE